MIVWGGGPDAAPLNTGGRYNPACDCWAVSSLTAGTGANVPAARSGTTVVWTGTEMIVWGGQSSAALNTGGRYSPATDSWAASSLDTGAGANVPAPRFDHAAVWTGTEMIVWGGYYDGTYLNTGGRYNPATDSWVASSLQSGSTANLPSARFLHSAVWTGTEMIVWGGQGSSTMGASFNVYGIPLNTGGRYNPATDSWTGSSLTSGSGANVPSARYQHTAVWTGREMIVWGGIDGPSTTFKTGGRFNPTTDTWALSSLTLGTGLNVPTARLNHTAVWTGTEMIVWGGHSAGSDVHNGGRYNPLADSWAASSLTDGSGFNVPVGRQAHSAVWTGTEMIVWGGSGGTNLNTGGRYNPVTDSWAVCSLTAGTGANVPAARSFHTVVWTGTEMIVWGGFNAGALNSGGRYNPAADAWAVSSLTAGTGANVPAARDYHTAVWTGTEMIVWGGYDTGPYMNTGGRYNPSNDGWTTTSLGANLPTPRSFHSAVWTGTEMIVWGGDGLTATGGRYCACPFGRLFYRDADGDGYGNAAAVFASCDGVLPPGYVESSTDCDDANAGVHPGAIEICNAVDDNCDGAVNESGNVLCDDGNPCTADGCNVLAGCSHGFLDGSACADASPCTTNETCRQGDCLVSVSLAQAAGSPVTVGTGPRSIAMGDFDGDGKLDLAVLNGGSVNVTILVRTVSGGFVQAAGSPIATGTLPRSIVTGDWNGDGKLDLAVTNQSSGNLTILMGAGTGAFSAAAPVSLGTAPYGIAVGDWNRDGKLDLAVTNYGTASVSIGLGNGAGGFTSTGSPVGVGTKPVSLAAGDWDGDGKLDLAVANNGSDNVTILRGDGLGGFTAIGSAIAAGNGPVSVVSGDWNADGKLDLAVANASSDDVTVLLGDGSGGFVPHAYSPLATVGAEWVVAGDVNVDGRPDLAVASTSSNQVTIFLGTSSGRFAFAGQVGVGSGPGCVATGDLNGDGKTDLAVANGGSANVTILLNTASTPSGTACDDGNACTTGDVCANGSCSGVAGSVPAEVNQVSASKSGVTAAFDWSPAGGASVYDMLRGRVRDWPVGSNPSTESCFDNAPVPTASDGAVPAAGDGYWYLVRAQNACGSGGYGSQGSHGVPTVPRSSTTCP